MNQCYTPIKAMASTQLFRNLKMWSNAQQFLFCNLETYHHVTLERRNPLLSPPLTK